MPAPCAEKRWLKTRGSRSAKAPWRTSLNVGQEQAEGEALHYPYIDLRPAAGRPVQIEYETDAVLPHDLFHEVLVGRDRVAVRVFPRFVLHVKDVRAREPAEHDGERRGICVLRLPGALCSPVVLCAVGRRDQDRDRALYIAVVRGRLFVIADGLKLDAPHLFEQPGAGPRRRCLPCQRPPHSLFRERA